jgi:soluble lytic murein transglycosylase-like protein
MEVSVPVKKTDLIDALSVRFAIAKDRKSAKRWRLQSRRTMTLLLGAALSIGGVSDAFNGVHYVVQKDLDAVKVVQRGRSGERVVADLQNSSFAGNSVYKLARMVPSRFVSRESSLFDDSWFGSAGRTVAASDQSAVATIGSEIKLINNRVREQFFSTSVPFGDLIHAKAAKYDVDPALVAAVMEAESRFKHRARSQVGAQGLMQLMPRTGRWMGARNLYDPEQNIDAGTRYLKYLSGRFDGNQTKIIAAYNAGEGNVQRYGGVPPYRETRTYVKKVLKNYEKRNEELKRYSAGSGDDQGSSRCRGL